MGPSGIPFTMGPSGIPFTMGPSAPNPSTAVIQQLQADRTELPTLARDR